MKAVSTPEKRPAYFARSDVSTCTRRSNGTHEYEEGVDLFAMNLTRCVIVVDNEIQAALEASFGARGHMRERFTQNMPLLAVLGL